LAFSRRLGFDRQDARASDAMLTVFHSLAAKLVELLRCVCSPGLWLACAIASFSDNIFTRTPITRFVH
jgi:hypothetical protein